LRERGRPVPLTTAERASYDDACKLVSKTDLEAAFATSFEEFKPEESLGYKAGEKTSTCSIYQAHERTAKGALGFLSLQIVVDTFDTEEAAKKQMTIIRGATGTSTKVLFVTTDVETIGDEAFFMKDQVGNTTDDLYVRKGEYLIHFQALKFDGIDSKAIRPPMLEVARKAVQ
jgi:hypothetical protein